MNSRLKNISILAFAFGALLQVHSQGYIVPNGVLYAGYIGSPGYEIDVVHDPTNANYTGFALKPQGNMTTFLFNPIVDVGVRVFLVSSGQPVSLSPILSHSYTELLAPNSYVFANGDPFYVGLYTGNQSFAPPDGIYSDPLFGWAELVNNNGVIQMLDSALEYKGGGIYAGTQNIIGVPEPSLFAVAATGAACLLLLRKARRLSKAG